MKIATLIPAFKPQYIPELLVCLRAQTVRPEIVLISDDSPDGAFLASPHIQQAAWDLRIEAIRGPRAGGLANYRHLLERWAGSTELVHFLSDDDIIYPDFYRRHLEVHATGATECSISRRWTALESGQPVGALAVPDEVASYGARLSVISPEFAFRSTVLSMTNWFGEFSNAVLTPKAAEAIRHCSLEGMSYVGLADIGVFLQASLIKPLGWIADALGFFRMNPQQNTQQNRSLGYLQGHLAWIALAVASRRLGMVSEAEAQHCIAGVAAYSHGQLKDAHEGTAVDLLPELIAHNPGAEARFLDAWRELCADA